jgi:hypothetical protein
MIEEPFAGRRYAQVYKTARKEDVHEGLLNGVERSGGRVLYATSAARAPTFLGRRRIAGGGGSAKRASAQGGA